MAELKPVGALYSAGDFQEGLERLQLLWKTIPEPKAETLNAYLVVEYGVALSLKIHDLDQAKDWADQAPMFAAVRHDIGEVEFLIGKVAFERGELDTAKSQFLIADAKSEGRVLEGEDARYRRLIR